MKTNERCGTKATGCQRTLQKMKGHHGTIEHQKNCGCRPMPRSIIEYIKKSKSA